MNEFHKFPQLGENKVSTQLGNNEVYLHNWVINFIFSQLGTLYSHPSGETCTIHSLFYPIVG